MQTESFLALHFKKPKIASIVWHNQGGVAYPTICLHRNTRTTYVKGQKCWQTSCFITSWFSAWYFHFFRGMCENIAVPVIWQHYSHNDSILKDISVVCICNSTSKTSLWDFRYLKTYLRALREFCINL